MNTNPTIVSVFDIIELGTATKLTLGQNGQGTETPTRPVGFFSQRSDIVLGAATTLTMGGGSGGAETKNRPFGSLMHNEKKCHKQYIVDLDTATKLTMGGGTAGCETLTRPAYI